MSDRRTIGVIPSPRGRNTFVLVTDEDKRTRLYLGDADGPTVATVCYAQDGTVSHLRYSGVYASQTDDYPGQVAAWKDSVLGRVLELLDDTRGQ